MGPGVVVTGFAMVVPGVVVTGSAMVGPGLVVVGFATAGAGVATRSSELPSSSEESVSLSFQGFPPSYWLINLNGKMCLVLWVILQRHRNMYLRFGIKNVQNIGA